MMPVWLMIMCMILFLFAAAPAEGIPTMSPAPAPLPAEQPLTDAAGSLIGLWEFERTDELDLVFTSYEEFTPDGLCIFQTVDESGSVTFFDIDTYDVQGDTLDRRSVFAVSGDTLTITTQEIAGESRSTYHRVVRRPPELYAVMRCGDYCYTLDADGGATIMRYIGGYDPTLQRLDIPAFLDGHPVTGIGMMAFEYCPVGSIVLPDTITVIGDRAFCNAQIYDIVIPDSVSEIGVSAFADNLFESVTIPAGVRNISESAFASCGRLKEVHLQEGLDSIGAYAFSHCDSMERIILPDSLSTLESNPFCNCESLREIVISDNHPFLYTMGGALFTKADRRLISYPCDLPAAHYEIPDGTTVIADHAFQGNRYLTSVTIPDSVTEIGEGVFANTWSLEAVTIPRSVTEIGRETFYMAVSLQLIRLPDGLTEIGDDAFRQCDSLSAINIPDSVIMIGHEAFRDCYSLTDLTLPEGIQVIGSRAFSGCTKLTGICLPASLTEIGDQAFTFYDRSVRKDVPLKVIFTVEPGTCAEQYCIGNGMNYVLRNVAE
ncbi:MAG: leucine-rich repeat domain-containing protein [Clostridia bacterium]|nr:leucine-rich repeat domain-containing protein [Clostridia bacterium]